MKKCKGMINEWEKLTGKKWKEDPDPLKRAPTVKHEFVCLNCGKKLRPLWNRDNTRLLGFGRGNIVCSLTCALGKLMQEYDYHSLLGERFAKKYNQDNEDN